jgi:hypothetical protein
VFELQWLQWLGSGLERIVQFLACGHPSQTATHSQDNNMVVCELQ